MEEAVDVRVSQVVAPVLRQHFLKAPLQNSNWQQITNTKSVLCVSIQNTVFQLNNVQYILAVQHN